MELIPFFDRNGNKKQLAVSIQCYVSKQPNVFTWQLVETTQNWKKNKYSNQ